MTDCYVVEYCYKYEGCSVLAVHTDEAQAIGLRNRLRKRCDDGNSFKTYEVRTVPLNPDPVETTQKYGEVER